MSLVFSGSLIVLGAVLAALLFVLFSFFNLEMSQRNPMEKISASDLARIEDKERLIELAHNYKEQGKLGEAISCWDRYLELAPDSIAALAQRGKLLFREREYDPALEDLEKSVEVGGESYPEVYLCLARIFRNKGNVEEALRYYSEYMEVAPENISVVFEIAETARKGREHDEAIRMYELARENGVKDLYVEATLKLVEMCFDLNKKDLMADYLKDLYELEQKDKLSRTASLTTRYFHGRLLQEEDRSEEALKKFRRVHREQPDFRDVREIMKKYIEKSDGEMILEQLLNCSPEKFRKICLKLARSMDFEPDQPGISDKEGCYIEATRESGIWSSSKVLFAFKQWDYKVGEWPVKEFELELIDGHYSRGVLVCPRGYKKSALQFVRDSDTVEVISPGKVIESIKGFSNLDVIFDESDGDSDE